MQHDLFCEDKTLHFRSNADVELLRVFMYACIYLFSFLFRAFLKINHHSLSLKAIAWMLISSHPSSMKHKMKRSYWLGMT